MEKKTIAVFGATGAQGNGVVEALVNEGSFNVRAITRNPEKYTGKANETARGDLNDIGSLADALKDAYGVFVVTNFWEGADEVTQAKNAVQAAKAAGVQHFVWSTLPDVEKISHGAFDVPHFTLKARADEFIKDAGLRYTTFVQPPFYFQNLTTMMAPQQQEDGSMAWTLPIDPTKKAIHMSDINDLGKVVAGALLHPEKAGQANYLSLATHLNSFDDIRDAYKANGKDYKFKQVPPEIFSTFFEGAKELAEMFGYFEKHTYMGPNSEASIRLANEVTTGEFISLKDWLAKNA
jgi:uncharacterized protein YbjT (DUF2867 family)